MNNLQQQATEASSNHGENTSQNEQLVTHEKLEGTPFTIVKQENKWLLVIGNTRMIEDKNSREEILETLDQEHWTITMRVTIMIAQKIFEEELGKFLTI